MRVKLGRELLVTAAALLVAMAIGAGAVVWSLLQVPDFYEEALAEQADPEARREAAKQFVAQTVKLADEIKYSRQWSQDFTQQQINGWLAEELHQKYPNLLPPGVRNPRVRLDDGSIQVGFQYESRQWSGIVSLRLKAWVPKPNDLAIAVESIQAGLMPVPLDRVLEQVSRELKTSRWRSEWTQVDGDDVLIVHLDGTGDDQPALESVQVEPGVLRISGRTNAGGASPSPTNPLPRSRAGTPVDPETWEAPRLADQSDSK